MAVVAKRSVPSQDGSDEITKEVAPMDLRRQIELDDSVDDAKMLDMI